MKRWHKGSQKVLSVVLGGTIFLLSFGIGAVADEVLGKNSSLSPLSGIAFGNVRLGNSNEELPELGGSESSEDEDIPLGSSGKELLFQFRKSGSIATDDFKIELSVVGDVDEIKMTTPTGGEEIQKIPELEESVESSLADDFGDTGEPLDHNTSIGLEYGENHHSYKIKETRTLTTESAVSEVEVKANEAIGYTEDSIVEIDDNQTLETDSKVDFPLESLGIYDFALYNDENQWIGTLSFNIRVNIPGEIHLEPVGNFQIVDTVQMRLDYLPTAGHAGEKLYIILPPFFKLGGLPQAQQDITFAKSTIDLPKSYYEADPHGAVLIAYANENPTKTKVDVLEVTLAPTVNNEIALTLTMTLAVPEKRDLSALMILYSTEPDKIPFKTIVESRTLGNTVLATEIFTGTSVLTDPTGATPIDNRIIYPVGDQTLTSIASYRRYPVYAYSNTSYTYNVVNLRMK